MATDAAFFCVHSLEQYFPFQTAVSFLLYEIQRKLLHEKCSGEHEL